MLKRLLIALCVSFIAVQSAQACGGCGCRDKKAEVTTDDHDHDEDHGDHTHAADGAKVKLETLKTSGTFSKVKKVLQFKATDGAIYKVNKKSVEKVSAVLDQKVNLIAKFRVDAEKKTKTIVSVKKVAAAK